MDLQLLEKLLLLLLFFCLLSVVGLNIHNSLVCAKEKPMAEPTLDGKKWFSFKYVSGLKKQQEHKANEKINEL